MSIQWDKISLLGVDVGYSKKRRSTGIATYVSGKIETFNVGSQFDDRERIFSRFDKFSLVAIDGPIVPDDALNRTAKRPCEYIFIGDAFGKRCKPGLSHSGQGIQLRSAAADIVDHVTGKVGRQAKVELFDGPLVRSNSAIVEAFPNAFIGVLLADRDYDNMPRLKRGRKFDELYDRAIKAKIFEKILLYLQWNDDNVIEKLISETHHEKRAALICILTAACAVAGKAKFIGDRTGGWFCLADESLWPEWSKNALLNSSISSRMARVFQA